MDFFCHKKESNTHMFKYNLTVNTTTFNIIISRVSEHQHSNIKNYLKKIYMIVQCTTTTNTIKNYLKGLNS